VRRVSDRQIAAGGGGIQQLLHDRVRIVVIEDVPQDSQHRDRDRLREVQRLGGSLQDLVGVARVGIDVVGDALRGAGEQSPSVRQYERIVVDIDDAALRRDRLRDLMGVVEGGQAGTDVEELPNPRFAGEVCDDADEERANRASQVADVREDLEDLITHFAVHREVVLAAQPVVPDTGRVRDGRVDLGSLIVGRRRWRVCHGGDLSCVGSRFAPNLDHASARQQPVTPRCWCVPHAAPCSAPVVKPSTQGSPSPCGRAPRPVNPGAPRAVAGSERRAGGSLVAGSRRIGTMASATACWPPHAAPVAMASALPCLQRGCDVSHST